MIQLLKQNYKWLYIKSILSISIYILTKKKGGQKRITMIAFIFISTGGREQQAMDIDFHKNDKGRESEEEG